MTSPTLPNADELSPCPSGLCLRADGICCPDDECDRETGLYRGKMEQNPFAEPLPNADELEVAGRDIFECSNQLGGYVGPNTEDGLASFLIRESSAAAELAGEIVRLRESLSSAQAQIEHWRGEAARLLKSGQDALDAYETEKSRAEAAEAEVKRLREAISKAERAFNNIRGAIESNQVVDKDAHGTAVRARDDARAALSGGHQQWVRK